MTRVQNRSQGSGASANETRPRGAPHRSRLIVIDDEPEMAELIAELAEMAGYRADVASNAREFLERPDILAFDVVVIDLVMPDADGFEVINALAERGCTAAIVMVSGYNEGMLNSAGRYANARGLNLRGALTKPFTIDQVGQVLQEIRENPGSIAQDVHNSSGVQPAPKVKD